MDLQELFNNVGKFTALSSDEVRDVILQSLRKERQQLFALIIHAESKDEKHKHEKERSRLDKIIKAISENALNL